MLKSLSIKKIITTYPMLFGAFIGLLILIGIFSMPPWIEEDLGRHKTLAEAAFYTMFNFIIFISTLWKERRRSVFWPIICALLLVHVLGVLFYSTHVQRIRAWQWPILGMLEFYAAAFFLFWWSARRIGRYERRRTRIGDPT
jgi:hypothetical membrane protein